MAAFPKFRVRTNGMSRRAAPARRILLWSLGLLTVASLCLLAWQGAFRPGLIGSYYTNPDWQGSPVVVSIDSLFSTSRLTTHAARWRTYSFSVSWKGFLEIDRPGSYTATIRSDDGAWLFVDERLVINNGGEHTLRERSATVVLDAGLHPIELRYFQGDGDFELGVTLAYGREAPSVLSASTLFPTKLAYAIRHALPPRGYLIPLLWSLSIAGMFLWLPVRSLRRHVRTHAAHGLTNTFLLGVSSRSVCCSACPGSRGVCPANGRPASCSRSPCWMASANASRMGGPAAGIRRCTTTSWQRCMLRFPSLQRLD